MKKFYKHYVLATLSILASVHTAFAQDAPSPPASSPTPPTFLSVTAKQVSIQDADRLLRARASDDQSTTRGAKVRNTALISPTAAAITVGCATGTQPNEIVTLAASLKCDPDLIFEYVYNNIEYEPLFGSNKGALGTLLDQRGNDIDEAQLLVALLNAAGVSASPAFFYGAIRLTGVQAAGWLGVKNDAQAIVSLLSDGGIPLQSWVINPDGTLSTVDVGHVWVQVTINGNNYQFDPSFKLHTVTAGLSNLGAVLNYSQAGFIADAGGSANAVSISNLNRTNIRNDLTGYANNLVNYIKSNNPAWTVGDIIGGKTIQPLTGSPLRNTTEPNLSPSQPSGFPQNWGASVPNVYRTCFTISMPGVPPSLCGSASAQTIQLYADQTYGHRITVFSVPSGSNFVPTLLIDGAPPPNGQNTGTAAASGTPWAVYVAIEHPNTDTSGNQAMDLTISAGGDYLIGMGWGQVNRGMVQKHHALLSQAIAAGNAPTSEVVLGESLAVISYSWLAEVAGEQRISDGIAKVTTLYHHGVGITGQTAVQASGSQGPYVDLPMNYVSTQQQTSVPICPIPGNLLGPFLTLSNVSSSLESAVLEQTQANVAGIQAASTVHLIDMNAATGAATYFADGTTATGLANYFSSIRPQLALSYSATDLGVIDRSISSNGASTGSPAGNQVLLPLNGHISVGTAPWTGAGYTILGESCDSVSYSMSATQKISGGLSGGFTGANVPTPIMVASTDAQMQPGSGNPSIPAAALAKAPAPADPVIAEPVDAITGAYIYQHADMTTGGGSFPYALPFTRTYTSAANTNDIGLGNGWSHNFSLSATRNSDPYAGLGESASINSAAAIAAIYVSIDMLGGPPDAKHLTMAAMTGGWLTDQLTNNAVQISSPGTKQEYVFLPHADGSASVTYNPPLGSSVVLTGSAPDQYGEYTTFTYQNKDQTQLAFNSLATDPNGQISAWTFPNGMKVNFAYGYNTGGKSYLTSVSNNLGRSLALGYSGTHLSSVTDDTGRSMGLSYDGSNNLAGFTDPLGYQTRFAYDGAASHLTQIFYPSNPGTAFVSNVYDPIGRVFQQSNANGNTTNFYIAGTRTESIDPAGDRHVTYQTARGKVLRDDAVLSSSVGNVFNDTAQSNGAINVSQNQYDGLDRLTLATAPEGGTVATTYSPDLLSNVIRVTRTAKPGSPLAWLITSYAYDPVYNKPTKITDPLGLVALTTYDGATGNLLTSVADAGAGHFNATSSFAYNSFGQLATSTDALGTMTRYIYDGVGNLVSKVADVGRLNQTTTAGYSALGDVTSMTDPNGNVTTASYDADRRKTGMIMPPTSSAPGPLTTALTYDSDGRLLQTRDSAAGIILRTTSQTYTLTGQPATATDANGNVTHSAYDAVDRLSSVTDPLGNVTRFGYDAMSRRIAVYNPAIQAMPLAQASYTPDGLQASLADAADHATLYAYDGFDRLGTATYPNASTESYIYDADANPRTRTTRKGDLIVMAYDTLNRMTTKAPPSPAPIVTYQYDLLGQVTGVSDNSPAIVKPTGAASYATTATYDAMNRPLTIGWSPAPAQAPPTASSVQFNRSYDADDRMSGQTSSDSRWMLYPTTASNTSYTANNLNQYSAVNAVTPTYDGNGNLTFDGAFTYSYDAENRLTGINNGGAVVAQYAYDAQGRRKSKTVGSANTIYVTDADNREVLEYDGVTGAKQTWYAYGAGIDDVLSQMNIAAETRATMIPDSQGSILATLDSGSAALTVAGYLPYGENTSNYSGTYRYTGRRIDPETGGSAAQPSGLYYYRARMYSPTLGRFLQPDPTGYADGANLYAYVGEDPLNLLDPYGLSADGPGAIASWWNDSVIGFESESTTDSLMKALQAFGPAEGAILGAVGGITEGFGAVENFVAKGIANTIPETLARVIPDGIPAATLGRPGTTDVFVTAAKDIQGLNAAQIAERLTIQPSPTGFRIMEFQTPQSGIASPVFRPNPGFIGGGRTLGGAREFVIPNQLTPLDAVIRTVR
jgi:RHS repeat-associated protein